MLEKEFMIASLRRQRDLLDHLVSQLNDRDELEKGSRMLYDQVTKHVEHNLKELRKLRKTYLENHASYQFYFPMEPKKQNEK